jgi:hypothetical protein
VSSESSTERRLSTWQQVSAWPVIVLSFAYIAVYVTPIYWYPLSPELVTTCHFPLSTETRNGPARRHTNLRCLCLKLDANGYRD